MAQNNDPLSFLLLPVGQEFGQGQQSALSPPAGVWGFHVGQGPSETAPFYGW